MKNDLEGSREVREKDGREPRVVSGGGPEPEHLDGLRLAVDDDALALELRRRVVLLLELLGDRGLGRREDRGVRGGVRGPGRDVARRRQPEAADVGDHRRCLRRIEVLRLFHLGRVAQRPALPFPPEFTGIGVRCGVVEVGVAHCFLGHVARLHDPVVVVVVRLVAGVIGDGRGAVHGGARERRQQRRVVHEGLVLLAVELELLARVDVRVEF
mmetsp:Transcript_10728/g.36976  ORF Transcript_10728/g.36976 Transcript_10728/m.36976 type:complete len:213 (+) Transcript_10728:560-1198(+)